MALRNYQRLSVSYDGILEGISVMRFECQVTREIQLPAIQCDVQEKARRVMHSKDEDQRDWRQMLTNAATMLEGSAGFFISYFF